MLICIVPVLTIIGFILYFLDVNNPILFNTIGIIAAGAIAVIVLVGLGF